MLRGAEGASLASARAERRLAAILAADVAGYSRLMGADEEGTLRRLKAHRMELVDPKITEHRGRIVKTTGDGMLVEFASVVDALRCAVEVQRGMVDRNTEVPQDKRIEFRVGINVGDIIIDGDDIFGDGVNVAARLEGLAEPGGICISRKVRDEVRDKLDLAFEDMGEQQVKNIVRPVRVFRITDGSSPTANVTSKSLPLPDKPSVAVLPFQNMSGDPEQEYFSDGMTEEIITALSRVKWFFVIARNSTFTYKGRAVDVARVGRELGVKYVLEGSVRKAGNRVRVTAQLIEAMNGYHVWADRFDGELANVFDLQDQVTESVVGAIEPSLTLAEIERAKAKPTENLSAYDLYLRALPNFYTYTKAGSEEALRLLRRAVSLDPGYAVAKAFAAFCIVLRENQRFIDDDSEIEEGIRLAREALDTARDDPTVLHFAGLTLSALAQDYEAGLAALDRALALNVNSAQALSQSGFVRAFVGDWRTAIEHFTRAIRLSPLDQGMSYTLDGLALAHMMAGDYEEALKFAMRSLREMPRNASAHRHVAASLALLGRSEEARAAMPALLAVTPSLTISSMRKGSPFRDAAFLERYMWGLKEAGLPE
jgi:TolB-like protein/class 3 adenylate cyclase/Tfp pilus assembly protein PilF